MVVAFGFLKVRKAKDWHFPYLDTSELSQTFTLIYGALLWFSISIDDLSIGKSKQNEYNELKKNTLNEITYMFSHQVCSIYMFPTA